MRERSVEQYLVKRAVALGGVAWKWVSPGTNGVPDRIVVLPAACPTCRRALVGTPEVKAPGKPLDPLQVERARVLGALGMEVGRVDTHEGVERFLVDMLRLER